MNYTPSESGGVVLAVDDIPRNLQLLGAILTSERFEVLFATSGEAALARLAARKPDLILLDLMMPGMDGMELCRRLKADPEFLEIPIIFLTAAAESATATEALETGAVDYITKPFNAAELLARVRTHVMLKRTRDELLRIITQKNELLSALAHDLKNPLSSIRYAALMLQEQDTGDLGPRRELVESILETGNQALEFIERELARNASSVAAEVLTIESVEPVGVVSKVVRENLAGSHRKNIEIEIDVEEPVTSVLADADGFARALDNLVSNAVKFAPLDTRVTVWIGPGPQEGFVRIGVRDQGPGLSEEDCKHLFEPYRRLSARPTSGESSTGLGLSIARDLVIRMEGRIGREAIETGGSEFWIDLRAAE